MQNSRYEDIYNIYIYYLLTFMTNCVVSTILLLSPYYKWTKRT